jgi:DnaJ-class molecular chaperone
MNNRKNSSNTMDVDKTDYGGGFSGAIIQIFESMFGGRSARGGGRTAQFKGQDFNAELHLDLKMFTLLINAR